MDFILCKRRYNKPISVGKIQAFPSGSCLKSNEFSKRRRYTCQLQPVCYPPIRVIILYPQNEGIIILRNVSSYVAGLPFSNIFCTHSAKDPQSTLTHFEVA